MNNFFPWGRKASFGVDLHDLEYRPLSESRTEMFWISTDNKYTCISWTAGETILMIPYSIYLSLLGHEEPGELGKDLIDRIYNNLCSTIIAKAITFN